MASGMSAKAIVPLQREGDLEVSAVKARDGVGKGEFDCSFVSDDALLAGVGNGETVVGWAVGVMLGWEVSVGCEVGGGGAVGVVAAVGVTLAGTVRVLVTSSISCARSCISNKRASSGAHSKARVKSPKNSSESP